MKQKHVDASREIRLWLGTIITPVAAIMIMNPGIGRAIGRKVGDLKYDIKDKFKRKGRA